MDVAFQMRGIPHVILVDAARSGSKPGTLFELPGSEVEQTPPLAGINLHAFRWDHALAFARWLLKEDYPSHITVYLIEGENFDIGAGLSAAVDQALERLADRLLASWQSLPSDSLSATATDSEHKLGPNEVHLDFDGDGYLRIGQAIAARFFPADVLVPLWRDGRLLLLPTRGAAAGGLLLKQRNAAGDRCVLLSELFQFQMPVGRFVATWHEDLGGLEVHLKVS
jgi:hydrogenase maturation protease